jgi:hypothetical protein
LDKFGEAATKTQGYVVAAARAKADARVSMDINGLNQQVKPKVQKKNLEQQAKPKVQEKQSAKV